MVLNSCGVSVYVCKKYVFMLARAIGCGSSDLEREGREENPFAYKFKSEGEGNFFQIQLQILRKGDLNLKVWV